MSGQGRSGQKPSQRLGSLAADKETEKAGRLGALRMNAAGSSGIGAGGGSASTGPSSSASGSAAKLAKGKFVPKVPAARKKKEPPLASEEAAPSAPSAAAGGDEFNDLVQKAQEAETRRAGRREGRSRGRPIAPAAPAEVAFGGVGVKPEAKPGATGFVGGAAGSLPGGRAASKGPKSPPGSSKSPVSGRKGSTKRSTAAVRKTADDMAVDTSEAFRSEDEAPEGPLDYGQNYPTMLPFLPPDQDAALQGFQQQPAAVLPSAVERLHDAAEGSMADYMQLADAGDGNEQLMFFQLPTLLPAPNRPVKSEPGRGDARPKGFSDDDEPPPKSLPIASAPGGLLGKLKVHRSGKVKLHLGDVAFDMARGIACEVRENAIVVNVAGKGGGNALLLGEVSKHIVCTPDMKSLLLQVK